MTAESRKGELLAAAPKAMLAFGNDAPYSADANSLKEFMATPAVTKNDGGQWVVNQDLATRQAEVGAAVVRLAANQERGDFKEGAKLSEPTRRQIDEDKATIKSALW